MLYKKFLLPLLFLVGIYIVGCVAQQSIYATAQAVWFLSASQPVVSTGKLMSVPPTFVPAPQPVVVSTGKTDYTPNESISVTITNNQSTAIVTYPYQTYCKMFSLQWQNAQGQWENMYHCRQFSLKTVTLSPHSTQTISLWTPFLRPPSSAPGKWQPGNYRIAFAFGAQGTPITKFSVAYSPVFVIA